MGFIVNPYRFGFSPPDIANLVQWFDASDISTLWQDDARTTAVTSNNDPVGSWQNKANTSQYVQQTVSASRPTYKTGVQNGLPAVRGDGADAMRYAGAGFTSDSYVSVFIVANNEVSNGGCTWCNSNTSDPRILIYTSRGAAAPFVKINVTSDTNITLLAQDDTSPFRQMTLIRNNTSAEAWRDGTSQGTASPESGDTSNDAIRFYVDRNAIAPYLTGHIAEIIAYEAVLSDTQRQIVEAYLKNKWGTP